MNMNGISRAIFRKYEARKTRKQKLNFIDFYKTELLKRDLKMYKLIKEENLKEDEAIRFIENSFRDGLMKTTGTDIDRIMPPVSRFASNSRTIKKQTIIDKLLAFFEKYFGLV